MSSRVQKSLLILVGFFGILSCAPRIGEEAPAPVGPEVAGTACLNDAIEVVGRFTKGQANDREVDAAWTCFGSAFTTFYKYVRGGNRELYTAAEIARFFEDNFLELRDPATGVTRPVSIPVELQTQFMKLKQVLIGGSSDHLSRTELLGLIQHIARLKDMSLRLNPHMEILALEWQPQKQRREADFVRFEKANTALQSAARDFAQMIQNHHPTYRMDDVVAFLEGVADFVGEEWNMVEHLRRFMPVAKKVKMALMGGDESEIRPEEWGPVLLLSARGYVQFLRYHYFVETPQGAGHFPRWDDMARLFEEGLSIFGDMVQEKPGREIHRAEIEGIFESLSQSWPEFRTSNVLLSEFLRLKQVFFGGSLQTLALKDFQNAGLKLTAAKIILQQGQTFLPLIFGEWRPQELSTEEALSQFDQARQALIKAGRAFGVLPETGYDLNHLSTLLHEWRRLYPATASSWDVTFVAPLVGRLKNILNEEDTSLLKQDQWPSLLGTGAEMYSLNVFYAYFLAPSPQWRDPQSLTWLNHFGDRILDVVHGVFQSKNSKQFSLREVHQIVQDLDQSRLLPKVLSQERLTPVVKPLLERLMTSPVVRLQGGPTDALRADSLEYLRWEMKIYLQTQVFVSTLFDGKEGVFLDVEWVRERIASRLTENDLPRALRIGLSELAAMLASTGPQSLDARHRLYVSPQIRLKFDLKSIETHNLVRGFTRLLIASYADEQRRIDQGIGLVVEEAEKAFLDFRSLAVEMDLIERDNYVFMRNRFREANIFMFRADGNNLASFAEIHEIVYAILSGLRIEGDIKRNLVDDCLPGVTEVRGETRLPVNCLLKVYRQQVPAHLDSVPEMQRFVSQLPAERHDAFIHHALKGAGWIPNSSKTVKMADAALLPQLLQYIEILYSRFDLDGDGVLSVSEARQAFPVFEELFRQLAKKDLESGRIRERDLLALFTYILRYGKPPSGFIEGLFKWYPWRDKPYTWVLATDRAMIAQILGFISDQISGQTDERLIPEPKGLTVSY